MIGGDRYICFKQEIYYYCHYYYTTILGTIICSSHCFFELFLLIFLPIFYSYVLMFCVQKVAQLTEVLEARETKVLELSQVNAALQDTNLRLKA